MLELGSPPVLSSFPLSFIEIAAIRPPIASSATAIAPMITGMFRLPPLPPPGPVVAVCGDIVYGGGVEARGPAVWYAGAGFCG